MYIDSISQNINNIEAITYYSTLHRDEHFNTKSVSIKDIIKINDNKSIEIILCPHVSSIFRSSFISSCVSIGEPISSNLLIIALSET